MASNRQAASQGTLYGIGVGPGDPELITLKAASILRRVPVICVPKGRRDSESYALSIVDGLIDRDRQEVLEIHLPMTKDRQLLEAHWRTAAEQIVTRLEFGHDVAFATEGDPSIYSTFIYLHRLIRLQHPEFRVEIVPGISAINAAAAAAGQALVDGAERLAVLPAIYEAESLVAVLEQFDAVVLLKVSRVFDEVLDALEKVDLTHMAIYVRRCGSLEQEIVRDVRRLRGQELDYLSLVIVRKKQL